MASASRKRVLVYGSNGYTARLLLPHLKASGIPVIVAGRHEAAIERLGAELGFEHRVFALGDPMRVDEGIRGVSAVLNAAGPFVATAPPLIDACLRQRVDYMDLTGELDVLDYAARCDGFARDLGVMMLPAIGFDVVPSDCLAVHLHRRHPTANRLTLSISASNLLSRGSARTLAENAGTWVHVRRDGVLEPMRFRTQTRWANFGDGERPTIAVSWGDLITAYRSTKIPNIETYFEATAFRSFLVTANQFWCWALRGPALRSLITEMTRIIPDGPSEDACVREQSIIVAEVSDGRRSERARLTTPEAYSFTADVGARVVGEVLRGKRRAGFVTPAELLGPDFVLDVPGVIREDLG